MNPIKLIKLGWKISAATTAAITLVLTGLFLNLQIAGATVDTTPSPTPSVSPSSSPSISPTPTESPQNAPSFPRCIDQTPPGDNAHYDSGMHQIVGDGLQQGQDDVYSLSNGNFLQCFIPPAKDICIQTDWWRTDQELSGWISVNGQQWNLGNVHYLAKNINYNCTPEPTPTPSPSPVPTPSPTPTSTPTSNNDNDNHQKQEQTQNNNQTVNITTNGTVAGATITKTPETGVGVMGIASMFSAAPFGVILSRFGKGKFGKKKEEGINEIAATIANTRSKKLS